MKKNLYSQFQKTEKFKDIANNIDKGKRQLVHGLNEEGLSYLCCNLKDYGIEKILLITENEHKSKELSRYVSAFSDETYNFETKELILYNVDALSREHVHSRVNVLNKIAQNNNLIVTSSIRAALNKIVPKDTFSNSVMKFEYGKSYDFGNIVTNLNNLGYERVDAIEGCGQFSVRGGIVDVFSPAYDSPRRLEFFDDEVDSIRSIDLKTQRSIKNEKKFIILPCNDVFFHSEENENIKDEVFKDYQDSLKKIAKLKNNDELEKNLKRLFQSYEDRLSSEIVFENKELLIPYAKDRFESIIDYFDDNCLIVMHEPDKIFEEIKSISSGFELSFSQLFEKGEIFNKQSRIYFDRYEIETKLKNKKILYHNGILKLNKNYEPEDLCQLVSKDATSYYGRMEDLSKDLNRYKYKGYRVLIVLSNKEGCNKLHSNLNDYECSTILSNDTEGSAAGSVFISVGEVKKGFEFPELKILLLTENEVFGTVKKKRRIKKAEKKNKIDTFSDLKIGDFVVHEHHGIGKYVGIEKLNIQNVTKDFLCIRYKGEDKLFVPIDQLSLIQKYIGSDSVTPKVNKMSSQNWEKVKERTQKAIEEMAGELVELYAKRKFVKGYSYSKDTEWQKDFEYKFPFEETDDQLRCVKEIKSDMERDRPMDRLLCGDVGFGKTEVALRAVFKAIMDGKQVAILVPTTILAQQHFSNIVDRFRGFPIKAEMLSRFRTSGQQNKIISDLNKGLIDIIVGTHKLLAKSIKFKDIGLLVIDEEQRFGVKHKETIKQLKENIDVLTLSATPIPRTLHMSMIGVRDMSLIEEPPGDRMPIQTYAVEHHDGIVKDAIERELSRSGQVYYVHNRVSDIESIASKIRSLVPEARVVVGHGQMAERELENVMVDFVNKEYDVLVCTTIIETGMDIPNVNTLIVTNADNFGLSQLYQLRGRVGRSNKTSFAFLTYQKNKILSEIAEKRLKAIREFTEFGSGFKIAMRDLEIRGCGNILGAEQHGHMLAIGYDLYVKFLDKAVKKLSGVNTDDDFDVTIELNVDGYIPPDFITNEEQKIEVYKKIAAIETDEDIDDITEEILDRYGNIPKQVDNLIKVAFIKTICKKLYIKNLTQLNKHLKIELKPNEKANFNLANSMMEKYSSKIKFDATKEPVIMYKFDEIDQKLVLEEIKKILLSVSAS